MPRVNKGNNLQSIHSPHALLPCINMRDNLQNIHTVALKLESTASRQDLTQEMERDLCPVLVTLIRKRTLLYIYLYTVMPAYSDTAYSDTPLIVTL